MTQPTPIDAVARVLEATEIERATARLLLTVALAQLHDALRTIDAQHETIAALRACERRVAVSLFGVPQ